MAETVVKDIKEDFLHCSICVDRLKIPKMLPCIHTFCCECLEKYTEKTEERKLACPTCRKEFELPESGIKGLQTNFHLVNLGERIDLFEKLTLSSEKSHQCDSCDCTEISTYCLECENTFCTACNDHHARFPALRSHSVVPIENFKEKYYRDSLKNTRVPSCDLHSSEKLRFYCRTCSKMICRDCTIVQHPRPEHQYVEAPNQANEVKKLLATLLEESQTQLQSKLRYAEEGNTGAKSVRNSSETLQKEIISVYEQVMRAIEQDLKGQMENLCAEVTVIEKSQSANIEGCGKLASTWIKRAQNIHKMTQKIIEESNTWELLAMSNDLISAFHTLRSDGNEFEWQRSDMEHGIPIFSPVNIPSFSLGIFINQVDVVVSDHQNNFITCAFDFQSSILRLSRLQKEYNYEAMHADHLPPYKWEKHVPRYAKLTVTADSRNCVFVGLGRWLVKFSFSTQAIEASWETSDDEESFITCIDYNFDLAVLHLIHNNSPNIKGADDRTIRKGSKWEKMAWRNNYEIRSEHTPFNSIISYGEAIFCTSCNHDKQTIFFCGYSEFVFKNIIPPNNLENSKILSVLKGGYRDSSHITCNINGSEQDIRIGNFRCYFLWSSESNGDVSSTTDSKLTITEYDSIEQKISGTWTVSGGGRTPLACFRDDENKLKICDKFGRVTVYKET